MLKNSRFMTNFIKISSVTEMHMAAGMTPPKHPLITFIETSEIVNGGKQDDTNYDGVKITSDMYSIMFKDGMEGSMGYGRTSYDFQDGTMIFLGPGQVMEGHDYETSEDSKGWFLMFHPDLIRKTELEKHMDSYSFFSYESDEALHLSDEEKVYIRNIAEQIRKEYSQNMDSHSHRHIISNLELLLNNCLRYYDRQFYTRTSFNKDFVSNFERHLKDYFADEKPLEFGVPVVKYFSEKLNMSANYLSDMLKKETGMSAKSHINRVLVEKTKSALLNSDKPVSQIAYSLGFEHPQSLTRLFKAKTGISPNEYRYSN